MFGPQPHGTTYVCIWELSLDALKASLSATEANVLLAAVNAFQMNFADLLNAPATEHALSVDPDGKCPGAPRTFCAKTMR